MTMDRAAVVAALDLRPMIGGRPVDAGTPTLAVLDPNSGTTLTSVCEESGFGKDLGLPALEQYTDIKHVAVAIDRSQDYV